MVLVRTSVLPAFGTPAANGSLPALCSFVLLLSAAVRDWSLSAGTVGLLAIGQPGLYVDFFKVSEISE